MHNIMKYIKKHIKRIALGLSFKFVGTIMNLIIPFLLSYIIDEVIPTENIKLIIILGIVMILCGLTDWSFNIIGNRNASAVARDITRELRHDLFTKIITLSEHQVDELKVPSLVSRMTNDTYNIHNTIGMLQRLGIRAPILLLGGIIITLILDPVLSAILIATLPFICMLVYFVNKKGMPLYGKLQLKVDKLVQTVRETFSGIRVIKALSKEEYQKRKLKDANVNVVQSEEVAAKTMAVTSPVMNFILNIGLVCVILVGAFRVDSNLTEAGKIIAFTTYFTIILNAMMAITRMFIMISKASASMMRINEVLDYPADLLTKDFIKQNKDYITFENVSFSYEDIKNNIENLSFSIPKGGTVGIIGPTGSGKTTLINLLMRFYDPKCGRIYLDGKDLRSYDEGQLRSKFGTVFQQDILFSKTIKENIVFNRDISDEMLEKALRVSQAKDFVSKTSEGLDTVLAQRGTNLSGGQKQRLLIARALANNPEILVLDDSSSALDYKTDSLLRKAIMEEYKPTLFIVSQRISSISNLDLIIVIDKGKVISMGRHEDLLETCSLYQDIYKLEVGNYGSTSA